MDSKELLIIDHKNASEVSAKESPSTLNDEKPLEALCHWAAVEPNALKSELLASLHPEFKIPAIRAHMLRGNFKEAEMTLAELELDPDEITHSEVLLEKSRMAAFHGDWNNCIVTCNLGLSGKPPVLTHLCLLQIRAVAFFELGGFSQSLNDTDKVLSQAKLFPNAVAVNFSKAQKVKTLLLLQNESLAQESLGTLWKVFLEAPVFNLDQLLVLLRLELEIRRGSEKPHSSSALACLVTARTLGDRLYEGMALLDLCCSLKKVPAPLFDVVASFEKEFDRIALLRKDANSEIPQTTSGRLLKNATREETDVNQACSSDQVLLSARKILVDLERNSAMKLESNLDWIEWAHLLSVKGVTKEDFFKKVWKMKYVSHLHDGVIRTYVHRLRKKYNLKISIEDGLIVLKRIVVI